MAHLSVERTGRITGSRITAVLGLSPYLSRDDVMREMVRERFWDEAEFAGNFVTGWGVEHEPQAIAEYELTRGARVDRPGVDQQLVVYPTLPLMAVTPDGTVGEDGVVEAKCPCRQAADPGYYPRNSRYADGQSSRSNSGCHPASQYYSLPYLLGRCSDELCRASCARSSPQCRASEGSVTAQSGQYIS